MTFLIWTGGCVVDPTTGASIEELSVADPDIALSAESLDFGTVSLGASNALTVTVQNVGTATLQLIDVSVRAGGDPYTVTAPGSLLVEPASSTTFTVTFVPSAPGTAPAELRIESTDPDEGVVIVPLLGEAHGSVLEVTPDPIALGSVAVGCAGTTPVTFRNRGDSDLVVSSVVLVGAPEEIALTLGASLPWTLGPGAEQTGTFTYAPLQNAADGGDLELVSTDPAQPARTVAVTGSGAIGASTTESFVQGHTEQVDVIVVTAELSDSAKDDARKMLEAYIDDLDATAIDFHLLVADTYGCHAGTEPYLTSEDDPSDRETDLERALDAGVYSGYADQGFLRAGWAIANDGAGYSLACNTGFFRSSARLYLLGITDGPDAAANDWREYEDAFVEFNGDEDLFAAHAVAPDDPSGCDRYDAGDGWADLVDDTGGLFFSYCSSNWVSYGDDLAQLTPGQRTGWDLAQEPVADTITVTVDGGVWLDGWSYSAADNRVDFGAGSLPDPESEVQITYVIAPGTCP